MRAITTFCMPSNAKPPTPSLLRTEVCIQRHGIAGYPGVSTQFRPQRIGFVDYTETAQIRLPNIQDVPLHTLTPFLGDAFFNSLREGYITFDIWFREKARQGRHAWIYLDDTGVVAALCIYAVQEDEQINDEGDVLPNRALKLSTFKVGELVRGRKIGEHCFSRPLFGTRQTTLVVTYLCTVTRSTMRISWNYLRNSDFKSVVPIEVIWFWSRSTPLLLHKLIWSRQITCGSTTRTFDRTRRLPSTSFLSSRSTTRFCFPTTFRLPYGSCNSFGLRTMSATR